jgi:hypothetical protein
MYVCPCDVRHILMKFVLYMIQLIKYDLYGLVDHHYVAVVGHVISYVLQFYLRSSYISIKEI